MTAWRALQGRVRQWSVLMTRLDHATLRRLERKIDRLEARYAAVSVRAKARLFSSKGDTPCQPPSK